MNRDRERRVKEALHRAVAEVSADAGALDLVEDIPMVEAFVDEYAAARIADARSSGASWAEIAQRLGVSKQAVHKRFQRKPGGPRRGAVIELRFERDQD